MDAHPTATRITTAARRILAAHGVEAVSMRAVGKEVGLTAMAIYRHFPDRAALLNTLADEGFAELAATLEKQKLRGTPAVRLTRLADVYLEHALHNPRLFELMFLTKRPGARRFPSDFKAGRSPTANVMFAVLQEGMASGAFKADDAWEVTFELGALSHGLIMLYLGGRIEATPEEFRDLYQRSLRRHIHGLGR